MGVTLLLAFHCRFLPQQKTPTTVSQPLQYAVGQTQQREVSLVHCRRPPSHHHPLWTSARQNLKSHPHPPPPQHPQLWKPTHSSDSACRVSQYPKETGCICVTTLFLSSAGCHRSRSHPKVTTNCDEGRQISCNHPA